MSFPRLVLLLCLPGPLGAQTALKVEPDPENVVASRLIGRWELDLELSRRLGGDLTVAAVAFQQDNAVVARIPARFTAKLKDFKIALAGLMTWRGDPLGDAESFTVMLARGDKPEADLLFTGGDRNNQPFTAFGRGKAAGTGKDAPEGTLRLALAGMERLLIAKKYGELIRTYAEPAEVRRMEQRGGIDQVAEQFAGDKADLLQKILEKVKGKDPAFNAERTAATFAIEGEERPLKLKLIEGRWYLVN